jgi:hypothetical protein
MSSVSPLGADLTSRPGRVFPVASAVHFFNETRRGPVSIFKETSVADRRNTAAAARQAMLEKFKAKTRLDDPAVQARLAERAAVAKARDERIAERKAQKEAERIAREAEAKRHEEERIAAEKEARRIEGEQAIALLAEQKAARDARYAARKARTGKKR